MHITVFYFDGCPNYKPTVDLLRQVLSELGVRAAIACVEVTGNDDAERHRFFGSPTVHVNGVDVDPAARERNDYGLSCRRYGSSRTPTRTMLKEALEGS